MHEMTNGKPCGLPDGHNGPHRSPASVEQKRAYNRAYDATPERRANRREHYWSDPLFRVENSIRVVRSRNIRRRRREYGK
jgi:hypothetical protein